MGKNYTFEILSQLICDVLNTDEKVINLYYNNGRVTWCVYPDTTLSNDFLRTGKLKSLRPTDIKLTDDIVKLFKLEGPQARQRWQRGRRSCQ